MSDKPQNPDSGAIPPRWLALEVEEFHRRLMTVLDIESGLREILLPSQHEEFVDGLAHVLDVEAGLGEVLAPSPLPADTSSGRVSRMHHPEEVVELLRSVDPRIRMRVRTAPDLQPRQMVYSHLRALRNALDRAAVLVAADDEAAHDTTGLTPSMDGILTKAHTSALAVASGINRVRDRDHALRRDLDSGIVQAVAQAQDVARQLTQLRTAASLGRRLSSISQHAGQLELDWLDVLHQSLTAVAQQPLPPMTPVMLEAFLNDFTACDLRGTSLDRTALTGVLWSDRGTTWPASINTSALKARSVEKPAGSGIYHVRFRTPTMHDLSERA
ncbi:hypothetical protein [Streptomyces sp. NPDC087300]|uniref:hypothetical protein n=1 Tax=Streptomyces sp. NPDC087300 TaxID=3365780 RepID=UPI003819FF0E